MKPNQRPGPRAQDADRHGAAVAPSVCVVAADSAGRAVAAQLARRLGLALEEEQGEAGEARRTADFALRAGAEGLAIQSLRDGYALSVEFASGRSAWRRSHLHAEKLLLAAVRARPGLRVLDATAGLGRDAFVLASAGCQLTLLERHPLLAALLEDGLRRARQARDSGLREIASRMCLRQTEAVSWMERQVVGGAAGERPDVVFLDPMFPPRNARNARSQVKKESQLLRELTAWEGASASLPSEAALLRAARRCARTRVVVKRFRDSPPLAGSAPAAAKEGRRVRYDYYLPAPSPSAPPLPSPSGPLSQSLPSSAGVVADETRHG